MKRRGSGSAFGSPACRAPSDLSAARPYWHWSSCLDLGPLITFIAADPMSGVYMVGLIAVCVPVSIPLHCRREALRPE